MITSAKKNIFIVLLYLLNHTIYGQDKYSLENTEVHFFSSAPLEDIAANNSNTIGVIDFSNNRFLFRVPIKKFQFKKRLMQEHFNENYLESDKYPYATYSGTFEKSYNIEKPGIYDLQTKGKLIIHGVEQERTLPAKIIVNEKKISIKSKFNITIADHNIKIPSLLITNIAEVVEIDIAADLKALNK